MAEVQRSRGLKKPCILLIVIAGMERFAFKGVSSNLVTYLTEVKEMSNSSAARTVNSWCGFTSMLPLLVAPLVDSYLNRYSTVMASSFLYLLGLSALTSTALKWPWIPKDKSNSTSSLFWSLYMISLGQGGYNPSLQAFGADQLENEQDDPNPTKNGAKNSKRSGFFQWWYFGVCMGSLLGVTVMSYIQDTISWGLGFAVPTLAMVTSIAFFLCGSRFYTNAQSKSADAKSFEKFVRTLKTIASRMIHCRVPVANEKIIAPELELEGKPLCLPEDDDEGDVEGLAKKKPDDSTDLINIARVVFGLLPIWTTLLLFAVIFQQPATFFTKQGMTMKRNLLGSRFKIPPATLQSAITISIIILMPFYESYFIPFARLVMRNSKGIDTIQRMGIGMFLSIVAMIFAALVETERLKISKSAKLYQGQPESIQLSIFWLLPQYILLGISDIFTVVGMQEFFYGEMPPRMRTMGIALYTSVFGVGSFLSALLISVIEFLTSSRGGNWFSDDMDEARLDKYYWFLASSSALSLFAFVVLGSYRKSSS